MLHTISLKHESEHEFLLASCQPPDSGIDPTTILTTRALMQVNKEARETVLAGRKLRSFNSNVYKVDTFFRGLYPSRDENRLMLHSYFFVNWSIDMFYFPKIDCRGVKNFLDETGMYNIERIALDIKGPTGEGLELYDLTHNEHIALTSLGKLSMLPLLKTICLALNFETVHQMFINYRFVSGYKSDSDKDVETSSDEQDEDDDVELPEREGPLASFGPESFSDWACSLGTDLYGFHRLESGSRHDLGLGERLPCVFEGQLLLLEDWINERLGAAARNVKELRKPDLHIYMGMDLFGGISHIVGGSQRPYTAFIDVE